MSAPLLCYEARNKSLVFVRIPGMKNQYMVTHRCVAQVECEVCKSPAGVPCLGSRGQYIASTHWVRRSAAKSRYPEDGPPDAGVEQDAEEALNVLPDTPFPELSL